MPASISSCCCCNKQNETDAQFIAYTRRVTKDLSLETLDSSGSESKPVLSSQQYLLKPTLVSTPEQEEGNVTVNKANALKKLNSVDDATLRFAVLNKKPKSMFQLSHLNLPSTKYSAVRALIFTMSALFGDPPEAYASKMDKSFYELGGKADSTLVAIACLHHYKFKIDVLEFLRAKSLREIVMRMTWLTDAGSQLNWNDLSNMYKARKMKPKHLPFLFKVIGSNPEGSGSIRPENWKSLLSEGKHVIFTKKLDKSIWGFVLNFDVTDDSNSKIVKTLTGSVLSSHEITRYSYEMSSKSILIELLQFLGDMSQKRGKIAHPVYFMADGVPEPQKVLLMMYMQAYNLRFLKSKKFSWVVTTFKSVLQSQIEEQIMGYEVLETTRKDSNNKERGEENRHRLIATKKI